MKQMDYVGCPVCGMNKVTYSAGRVSKGKPANLKWADFDVRTMEFVQVREGGGRGSGFHKVSAMTLEDAIAQGGAYLAVAKEIGVQLQKAVKEFKRLGLMP